MATLSVVVATYNEERNIGDCLYTVMDLANEIVVVDGSSTDRTAEVVNKYTQKFIQTENPPIFHINKQKAIDLATSDWVLQLDADERVPLELKAEIRKVIDSPDAMDGYWIPRRNYFLGRFLKKGGQYPDKVIRLFRRGKGKLPCVSVHEQIGVEGKVGSLKNDLWHITNPTFSIYLQHSDRYTTLEADRMVTEENDGFLTFFRYVFVKPIVTFLSIFVRHKGFVDGFPGFVFAVYSGCHFITSYVKFWERVHAGRH